MLRRCGLLVAIVLIVTEAADGSGRAVQPFPYDDAFPSLTDRHGDSLREDQSSLAPLFAPRASGPYPVPTNVVGHEAAEPQNQNSPSKPRRHTLRNIVIVVVLVGVLYVILGSAAKK